MNTIEVQLNAYVLPDDHKVWKCHPGKSYRFYKVVNEASAVFLDIRGLNALPDNPHEWDDRAVLKLLAADRWARELHRVRYDGKPTGSPGVGRIDHRNLTFLKGLLLEAKKGDLVVIPAEGWRREVLVGEFLTEPGDVSWFEARDDDETHAYLGRPVRWLAGQEKRYFSTEIIALFHSPTAFFGMPASTNHEIYRLAYGDYVYQGRFVAAFDVGKEKFTAEDSAVVSTWFNAFEVLQNAIETNTVDKLSASFASMGLDKLPDSAASELRINVNSPGSYLLKSNDAFAMALMVMFTLSGCSAAQIVNDKVTVKMKRVGSAGTDCVHQIEDTVKSMAKALGKARVEDACKLGMRASTDAKMTVSARLKN